MRNGEGLSQVCGGRIVEVGRGMSNARCRGRSWISDRGEVEEGTTVNAWLSGGEEDEST